MCCIYFRWQSQRLTVIVPADILQQMNFGSFPSHVLTTILSFFSTIMRIRSQRVTVTCLKWFGAHVHGRTLTKTAPRFNAALKWNPSRLCLARAVLMWPPLEKTCFLFGVCVSPSTSPPDPLSSEQRNVYMNRDCQGFKLQPLRNELSS